MKQNPQMITGSWDDITLVCGNTHDEPVNMVLQEGPTSLFYACPKYHRENRSEGERACNNRLSIDDFLKALASLHEKIIEAELRDERLQLTNYEWKDRKGTLYKVLKHEGNQLTISVYNKKAVNTYP